ncbi:MAG: hypothetical protein JNL97_02220 [Verrucomicrobiales bacterium]|nr:hypothetical protein [Verrucomicrobiales bacterium]
MNYRVSRLCRVVVDHAYFAGVDIDYLRWEPTQDSAPVLSGSRLLFRNTTNGFELYHEVDPASSDTSKPFPPLPPSLSLRFVARSSHEAYAGATEPLPSPARPFVLGNRRASLDGDVGRLHASTVAADADRARLVPSRLVLQHPTAASTVTLAVDRADGPRIFERTLPAIEGRVEAPLDFSTTGPGLYETSWDGVADERLYVDDSLRRDPPTIVLELVLRPDSTGVAILDADGRSHPGGRDFRIALAARATTWRYVVVPRTRPELVEDDLTLEDRGPAGHAFSRQAKGPLPNGLQAVVFQSNAAIPFRAVPYRGLALRTRFGESDDFVVVIGDLPNPRPGALALVSTPERPVSEVYVYL